MALARFTFLQAVNRVLQMCGEAPISSLAGQLGLALQAEEALNDVSRKLQHEGWSFNTDRDKLIALNTSTFFLNVGTNVTRVVIDRLRYPQYDIVQRGGRLYDRYNNTYIFDADIYADITTLLEWEDLPEHAHQYIVIKAGRQLQEAVIGAADLTKILLVQEGEAKATFLNEETVVNDHSMLGGNPNHTGVVNTYMPAAALRRS